MMGIDGGGGNGVNGETGCTQILKNHGNSFG